MDYNILIFFFVALDACVVIYKKGLPCRLGSGLVTYRFVLCNKFEFKIY